MRVLKIHNEHCPICEYELQHCQCIFGGEAHPNRDRRIRIVKDHLEMLSPKQVGHLIALEDWWQTSYGDEEDAEEFERFKAFIEEKLEPQMETEIARAIVHKMIDDAVIAEDAYPDLRKRMHDAVNEYEPQTEELPPYLIRDEDGYLDEFEDEPRTVPLYPMTEGEEL